MVIAHVLYFWHFRSSHIEIVLEERTETDNKSRYYRINPWYRPQDTPTINSSVYQYLINSANKSQQIMIDRSLDELVEGWKEHYDKLAVDFCSNNCADATAWFLNEFASIPKSTPCDLPVTCDYGISGFFVPSFLQFCCSLPGRTYNTTADYVKRKTGPKTMAMMEIDKTPASKKETHQKP